MSNRRLYLCITWNYGSALPFWRAWRLGWSWSLGVGRFNVDWRAS